MKTALQVTLALFRGICKAAPADRGFLVIHQSDALRLGSLPPRMCAPRMTFISSKPQSMRDSCRSADRFDDADVDRTVLGQRLR